MNDRSVHTHDVSQSVVVTGDGNYIRLTLGDSGVVLPVRRLQFRPPERRRRPAQNPRSRELDILAPDLGKLPFVGREDLFAELRTWLDDGPDISVHALTGRAGTGKTRLALELCYAIDDDPDGQGPWLAGFISPSDLTAVVEVLATRSFNWERQILLVLDYAAQCHKPLARWIDRLAYQQLDTKLRILLLEREAPESFGWWHELANPVFQNEKVRLDLFHVLRPTQLPDLAALDERRTLMAAALQAARTLRPEAPSVADVPAAGADPLFDTHLAQHQFGNPLSLVMAGVIALDHGPQGALALRRLDAARQLGDRELARLVAMAGADVHDREAMRHVIAFNGLAGGLPLSTLRQTIAAELTASHRQASLDVLLPLLEQELPPSAGADKALQELRLTTIQPDLIGEAAIIQAFTGPLTLEAEAPAVVHRAYALGQDAAAQALVRLVQDYAYALEDQSATEAEQTTARRVMDWLLALAREISDPEQLVSLAFALPDRTTILREPAAELTARLADFHRQKAKQVGNPVTIHKASVWIHNLANRLGDLGRREAALVAIEEAVQLDRALAEAHPDAFTSGLAISLSNLANRLGELGRHEAALAAAEESVQLHRALAEAHPDAFTSDLAMSLNTLSNQFSSLGRHEAALVAIEEAVQLDRALAEAHPDAFTPGLAMSLSNLANRLSDLGRREPALAAAEEAVQLHRALAEAHPDAFTPSLASSLDNLARRLSGLGRREAALAAAEGAVQLHRALTGARPDAFTPNLASSLSNLADRLSDLGRRQPALAAVEEAVQLHRGLAAARPDTFTPGLASSLSNLANRLSGLGRREAALAAAKEAVQLHRALAEARPDAFTSSLASSLSSLADRLSDLGRREPALAAAEEAVQLRRTLAEACPDAFTPGLANSLGNLANQLSDLGRGEPALAAAEEAVQLHRALAEARPDAFTPGLASSLGNLANRLRDMGRREAALATAREAIQIDRALARACPDAFNPGLAMSLNNLAALLNTLGQHEAALPLAEKAVQLYRVLAQAHPNAFTHGLARSLSNFANQPGGLGRPEAALAAIEEAVQFYRVLAKESPDAFTPELAASLNNLAGALSGMGRREAALAAIEEAVQLHRALAQASSDAFTPGLANSLGHLAALLRNLGRCEAALPLAKEAVQLSRALAQARPDAFILDLAKSLWLMGDLYAEVENLELALSTLREGVERLAPSFAEFPTAFDVVMTGLVQSYASGCEALGREPDMVLFAPILEVFERLRSKGGEG